MNTCEHCGIIGVDVDEVQYTLNYPDNKFKYLCDACFNNVIDN